MPRKEHLYRYSLEVFDKAFGVIDLFLMPIPHITEKHLNEIKAMVNDQIGAMKGPAFIAKTVYDYIDYDTKHLRTEIKIPHLVLVKLKQELTKALEGECLNGLQGEEEKEKG